MWTLLPGRRAVGLAAVLVALASGPGAASSAPDRAGATAAVYPWNGAGAFVLNEGNIDPTTLAQTLRANGFRWAAVVLHDGVVADPIDASWLQRFRAAAGSTVLLGGWGVNRDRPETEAALAAQLVDRYGLAFYIANAEREYEWTNDGVRDDERFGRSRRFVAAFRARKPDLPAAVSSFCHASRHDIDWAAWRDGGFSFLPQAYANDFGAGFGPDACAASASEAFPADRVHPTLGTYPSTYRVSAEQYATMLSRSTSTGFSLYLAEVDMSPAKWKVYGQAARAELGTSAWPTPDTRPIVQTTGLVPPPVLTLYTPAVVPVTRSGEVTLHFFASRSGKVRIVPDGAAAKLVPIRAGQNLLRVAIAGGGGARALARRPATLELTAISPTGLVGKRWILRLAWPR